MNFAYIIIVQSLPTVKEQDMERRRILGEDPGVIRRAREP